MSIGKKKGWIKGREGEKEGRRTIGGRRGEKEENPGEES
jgi:hypothetical protein